MKLENLDFMRLLPQIMQDDAAVKGLAEGINKLVPQLTAEAELMSTWDHIDSLSGEELDELAWELNILWYDTGANIGIKRELIRNSGKVYKHLGTKRALEDVIKTYFGEGFIEEWFQYEGDPGHFRVHSTNPTLTNEKFLEFMAVLNGVKRASAKLDGVIFSLMGQMTLAAGTAFHDSSIERYAIGAHL